MTQRLIGIAALAACVCIAPRAEAQSLLWNLPEDGTEVIYGGTMTRTETLSDGEETTMSWDRQLIIRSVGTKQASVDGEQVPARWLEFELRTGQRTEEGIQTGPVGTRIYRVLVAESAISAKPADERGIPNAFLPILEGYEQIGQQGPRKLESSVFEAYPLLTLIMRYKPDELTAGDKEPVDVPAGQFAATSYVGKATIESRSTRVQNQATMYIAQEMPFGLARWQATVATSSKDPNQPRDSFTVTSTLESEMEARAINENARAALAVP